MRVIYERVIANYYNILYMCVFTHRSMCCRCLLEYCDICKKKITHVTLHFNENREKKTGERRDVFGANFAFRDSKRFKGGS